MKTRRQKISKEIRVEKVSKDGSMVIMRIGKVIVIFSWTKYGIKPIGFGSDAQIYDPANTNIPKNLLADAYRQAAAIMRKNRKKYLTKTSEPDLFL